MVCINADQWPILRHISNRQRDLRKSSHPNTGSLSHFYHSFLVALLLLPIFRLKKETSSRWLENQFNPCNYIVVGHFFSSFPPPWEFSVLPSPSLDSNNNYSLENGFDSTDRWKAVSILPSILSLRGWDFGSFLPLQTSLKISSKWRLKRWSLGKVNLVVRWQARQQGPWSDVTWDRML